MGIKDFMNYFWHPNQHMICARCLKSGKPNFMISNMKKITLLATMMLVAWSMQASAKVAYKINLKLPNCKDSFVYLAHYYGKPLPTIYKRDSARFDKNGNAVLMSNDSTFVGGIYMMLLSDKKTYFEFLLNPGDDMTITSTSPADKIAEGLKFKNSPENDRFLSYLGYMKDYGTRQEGFKNELAAAKSKSDTDAVRKKATEDAKELIKYRNDYCAKYPKTLLSTIFKAMEVPQVPEGDHFLEDGKTKDSTFAYKYYKAHFWDDFNYQDDRLIHTPFLDGKLEEYMNKLVLPWPDSVEHECDVLLKKARGTKDLFKYTLWWLTRNAENSKIMGMDEVFVYLVENYYQKGDAFWLTPEELGKYLDRASKIAPNVIGNIAPEVRTKDLFTQKDQSMLATKAPYTLLIFYSPDCGHCQKEIPEIDSLYEAVLKDKGVKVFTVATEGDQKKIADFLTKHKLETKWVNTWDPDHQSDYKSKFDVYSTPTIYLMDDKKKIKGKRLDHSNIAGLIEMIEKKAKEDAKKDKEKTKGTTK